jgi:hypothetical protein
MQWRCPVNAFIVDLKNKPSELAKVAEAIAQKGIDITGFSASTCGDSGTLALVTDNEAVTQRALNDGGWKFRTIELAETELANRPGVLAEAAHKLGTAGVNIEAAFPTSMTGSSAHIVFATDNPVKAKDVLRELVAASR